ncbi:MAG: hypothetical protein A2051_13030 [Desulfovibrionales bacterium GWA2_65_9]|nr:MAG: hypothetical protein A2051_13030 [Desulfovibrionales bacterium GWA2_65_9]
MDQHISASAIAIVVDGYSTGEFYPAALRAKGLRPVHVASGLERGAPGLEAYATEALEHMRPEYEARFHGWTDLDGLAAQLAALAQYRLLLHLAGLRLEQAYGEGLTALDEISRRMLLVACKPGPDKLSRRAGQ